MRSVLMLSTLASMPAGQEVHAEGVVQAINACLARSLPNRKPIMLLGVPSSSSSQKQAGSDSKQEQKKSKQKDKEKQQHIQTSSSTTTEAAAASSGGQQASSSSDRSTLLEASKSASSWQPVQRSGYWTGGKAMFWGTILGLR